MWIRFVGTVSFCLVIAGCPLVDGSAAEFRDHSSFGRFEYQQVGGLGECPEVDSVYRAEIAVDAGGQYVLNMSVLEQGVAGADDCISEFEITEPCLLEVALAERVLTDGEVRTVTGAFSAVRVVAPGPVCLSEDIEPCLIHEFQWDSARGNDFPCGDHSIRTGPLVQLMEQLRAGSDTGD